MIPVAEAKAIITKEVQPLQDVEQMAVGASLGYRLAIDIHAPLDLPPFDQSNVDGYAVAAAKGKERKWTVIGEIAAGDPGNYVLQVGEAIRIFTGAVVPPGSDCVLMQEKVSREGDKLISGEEGLPGQFIRRKGAQIKSEALALMAGTVISPAVISFLDALGLPRIPVYRKPRVTIIVTGNELEKAGTALQNGKNYESNASALQAALQQMRLQAASVEFVRDEKSALQEAVRRGLEADLLLISGGISVGDYDYVKEVLLESGTECLFHGIAQKPGKPLFFGKNKKGYVFGLPGNPASALTCFYEYAGPVLKRMQGRENIFLKTVHMPVRREIRKKKGLSHFLKAHCSEQDVEALEGQDSFIMKSLASANAFIYLPAEIEYVGAGESVEVHLLPE
jgi:molybdopterin molybdotransferase